MRKLRQREFRVTQLGSELMHFLLFRIPPVDLILPQFCSQGDFRESRWSVRKHTGLGIWYAGF